MQQYNESAASGSETEVNNSESELADVDICDEHVEEAEKEIGDEIGDEIEDEVEIHERAEIDEGIEMDEHED